MATPDFEFILQKAGALGPWQIRLFLFIALNGFFMAFQHLGSVFLAATPNHVCSIPQSISQNLSSRFNWTQNDILTFMIPKDVSNGKEKFAQCFLYDDFTVYVNLSDAALPSNRLHYERRECSEWDYENTEFSSTIVTEWNLVCKWKWLMSSVQASYMAGVLVGCFIFGFISDRWGRRKAMILAQIIFCVASISTSFASHYIAFIIGRFTIAISTPGIFGCGFVFMTEVLDTKWRSLFGVYYQISFGFGYALLPGLAYFIRDWSTLQLVMSVPSLCMLLSYWVIPESPRWLITKNRFDEALRIIHQCAKANKKVLPPDDELLNIMKELYKKVI